MNIETFEVADVENLNRWLTTVSVIGIHAATRTDGMAALITLVDADGDGFILDAGKHEVVMTALRAVSAAGVKLYALDAHDVAAAIYRTRGVRLRKIRDAALVLKTHEPDTARFDTRGGYTALGLEPDAIRAAHAALRSAWSAITGKRASSSTPRTWLDEALTTLPMRSGALIEYAALPALIAAEIAADFSFNETDEIEQAVEDLWRWLTLDGFQVDVKAATMQLSQCRSVTKHGITEHGVDLAGDSDLTRRWLSRRGIEITDATGEPSLSHKHFATAHVPPAARKDFEAFVAIRDATRDAGKLTEITKAADRNARVYPRIDSYGAVTGRQAIRRPALQNLPEHLRPLLLASPDRVLVGADLAHVEPSIAAALSGDPDFIADVQPGQDPYLRLAAAIWGEEITKLDPRRQIAKRVLLASGLYGQGIESLAHELGISEREARRVRDGISTTYPRFARWRERVVEDARSGKRITTAYGRTLANPIPDEAYKAVNYLVQGTAADFFKRATLRVHDALGDAGAGTLFLPIHDELIVQTTPQNADRASAILTQQMRGTLRGVNITADAKFLGSRLGHA